VAILYTGGGDVRRPAGPAEPQPEADDGANDALPEVAVRAIRRLLDEHGLTQRALAREVGVTENTFSRWLGRKQGMPMATLRRVARRLGVTLESLFWEAPSEGDAGEALAHLTGRFDRLLSSMRLVTLYHWGTAGDPRSTPERELGPLGYQQVPPGYDEAVGRRGFALLAERDEVVARGVFPGDLCLANPDAAWHVGSLVVARVDGRLVLREVALDQDGRTVVRTAPEQGPPAVTAGDAFVVVGPVVLVLAVSPLDGGRGNARERPTRPPPSSTLDYMNRGEDGDPPRPLNEKP
jgi:transcriptional regulator with XRE-family HTH domain